MDGKHLCEGCRERKARSCFACFRSERDRLRARALATAEVEGHSNAHATAPCDSLFSNRPQTLTPAQRAHRFRMLTHLRRASARR